MREMDSSFPPQNLGSGMSWRSEIMNPSNNDYWVVLLVAIAALVVPVLATYLTFSNLERMLKVFRGSIEGSGRRGWSISYSLSNFKAS